MSERILCVDDDPNILQAYQRALRKQFAIDAALGGEEALEKIARGGPYAVVVADMRMPGLSGVQLLTKIRAIAPDTVRMMLTGNADQQTATDAVNQGHVFRFLTKPCPPELLAKTLEAGVAQYRLITAERELLTKTLAGCVKVLTDVLGQISPLAFGRAARVHRLVAQLCDALEVARRWPVEIGAMLSPIGCIGVPDETLAKAFRGEPLSQQELEDYWALPRLGSELIGQIPRLAEVADIVACQDKHFEGQGYPPDGRCGSEIPLGARILKVALDFDSFLSTGSSHEMALAQLHDRPGWYDPNVVAALRRVLEVTQEYVIRKVRAQDLFDGAILAGDIRSIRGTLLCARGQEVTPAVRARLKNYVANVGIQAPIAIFVPVQNDEGETSRDSVRSEDVSSALDSGGEYSSGPFSEPDHLP